MRKPDKSKVLLNMLTQRFLVVMDDIIKHGRAESVTDFANTIGSNFQQIHYMRRGKRYCTPDMIISICKHFSVNACYLFPPFQKNMYLGKTNEKLIGEKRLQIEQLKKEIEFLKSA